MTKTTENQQKGNYAENLVTAWLSHKCLVRPVASGTDIGIDLYCEVISGSALYNHFWVQVKAIDSSMISNTSNMLSAKKEFDKKHLEYWKAQPVPVYAFLVPITSWPILVEPSEIFGIRLSHRLLEDGLPQKGSATYHTNEYFSKETIQEDLDIFLNTIVPWDSSAILLNKGLIAPIKKVGVSGYEYPSGIGKKYLKDLTNSIYQMASWIGNESIDDWEKLSVFEKNDLVLLSDIVYLCHAKNFNEGSVKFLFRYAQKRGLDNIAIETKKMIAKIVDQNTDMDVDAKNIMKSNIEKWRLEIFN